MKWVVEFEVGKQDLGCVCGEYGDYLHFDEKGIFTMEHGTYAATRKAVKNYYLEWSVLERK